MDSSWPSGSPDLTFVFYHGAVESSVTNQFLWSDQCGESGLLREQLRDCKELLRKKRKLTQNWNQLILTEELNN